MSEVTGLVKCLRVADDYAFAAIVKQPGAPQENIQLWAGSNSVSEHVAHSNWVGMLRQAQSSGTSVTLWVTDGKVTEVDLGRAT